MLDEMFQQNASKFVILLEYENPCSFFSSFHARNEKRKKNYVGLGIPKVWQILNRFDGTFHQA